VTIGGPRGLDSDELVDGRYRVLERIGSGGMADVWCAEDQQLGRRVALKLLYRRFAEDPEFVERFRREASAAAGLQHPNVVGVYDRGEWEGTYYIAMELLEGSSLKRIIQDNAPLDPVWAIDVCVQVLRAARFAHRGGIIHRDIKPHNVIVDEEGRAKVTDFGIARAGASDMTETGSIMGTAQYLSPEQAQGHAVSAESDLYSIGIVLYEMLSGRLPFEGDSAVTIALKQVSEPPVPPSAYAEVPPDLEAVVLRALEKDPARRFADADGFIVALEAVRERIVTGADPGEATAAFGAVPPPLEPADEEAVGEQPERRAWPWALAIALILLLAGGALVFALTRPGKTVEVPNVTGIQLRAASASLQNRGFQVKVQRVRDTAPVDRVLRQDPQPRQRAKEGSTVTLTVSGGPGTAQVPDVAGRTRAEAKALVKDAGFRVRFLQEASVDVPAGQATRSAPAAGTSLERRSRITVFLSTGPAQVAVPGVVGKDKDAAISQLEAAGLQVDVTTRETADASADTVLAQNPGEGAQVAKGSTVTLTVAKPPPGTTVPAVTGSTQDEAKATLRGAGLRVAVDTVEVSDESQDGLVQDQSPGAGRDVPEGSTVTISVGSFSGSGGTTTNGGGSSPSGG
jgi:eukaryotic-like serine/threonine-protein kinase